jgi:hypothetical protein
LHLELFEQAAEERVFQQPASPARSLGALMAPILFGGWAAAGPVTPRTGASGTTSSRESGTETMAIFLWQAICDRDGRARHPGTRASRAATGETGP